MAKKKKSKAGRKPLEDKRVQVSFYPLQSEVDKVGGKDRAQEIALKAVQRVSKKQ